jgi:hypothetical protein
LGLSRAQVEQCVDTAEEVDALYFARDSTRAAPPVTLYLQRSGTGDSAGYLLVLSSTGLTAPEQVIEDAWPVPRRWFAREPRPLEVMEELCRRAGSRITFGTFSKTFYAAFEEPFEGDTLTPDIERPESGDIAGRMFAMVTADNRLKIGLAYMINDHRYKSAIDAG